MFTIPFLKSSSLGLLLTLGLLSVAGATAVSPKEKYEEGWVISMETRLNGKSQQTISRSGYKNHHYNEGYTAIFAGPDWEMKMYNHNVPLCYQSTYQSFEKEWGKHFRQISKMVLEVDLSNPWVNGKPVILNGEKATLYSVRSKKKVFRGHFDGYERLDLYMSDEVVLADTPAQFVSTYYGYKLSHHLPLRIAEVYGGQSHIVMDVKKVMRSKIPLSTYKVPNGLRKAKSPFEIFMGGETSAIFGDMADQLGKRELEKK